jgi:ATP-binding cassette subfamily C protein CydC
VLRRLLAVPGRQLWWIALAAGFAAVTAAAGVALVALAAHLISRAALVSSTAALALAITGVRACAVTRVVSRYLERLVGHHGTFRILSATRAWVFRRLVPLAPARLGPHRDGELLAHLTADVDTMAELPLRVLVPAASTVGAGVVSALVLGSLSPWLAVVAVAFLLVPALVVPGLRRRATAGTTAAATVARRELTATAVEGLRGLDELVAWGRPDLLPGALQDRTTAANAAQRRLALARGASSSLGALAGAGCVVALLGIAIPLVGTGRIEGVHLAVVALTALAAFEVVPATDAAWEHLGRAREAGDRVLSLLRSEPAVTEPPVPVPPPGGPVDLELRDAAGITGASSPQGVTARVPAGTTVVLTGPSGAGKSCLLAGLQRFLDYRGSILVGGVELRELSGDDARRLVAAVTQQDHLFDTSVRDNLLLADPDAPDDRLWSVLEDVGAAELVRSLPGELSARLGPDGADLSGGERQRILVARALLAERPLLVLDEATAHLDGPAATAVLAAARRRQGERTLVVITHRPELVDRVDLTVELPCAHDAGRGGPVRMETGPASS